MPTYEYRCKSCGEHLEVVQSFTDDSLTDCPACGEPGQLRKVFGNIGITFKGSGFYKTDSRSGSTSTSTSTESKPAESPSTDSGSKPAESKPAESRPAESTTSSSTSAA